MTVLVTGPAVDQLPTIRTSLQKHCVTVEMITLQELLVKLMWMLFFYTLGRISCTNSESFALCEEANHSVLQPPFKSPGVECFNRKTDFVRRIAFFFSPPVTLLVRSLSDSPEHIFIQRH